MRARHRAWWLVYGACAALTLLALSWMTRTVLDLERAEERARTSAAHEASVRLALWRMDSWIAPHVDQEAVRPYYEYLPYYSEERAYTRLLHRIEPGEVLSPSPLLDFRSEFIRIHFQLDARGAWTSPQVPTGNQRDLAEGSGHSAVELDRMQNKLRELESMLGANELVCAQQASESALAALMRQATGAGDPTIAGTGRAPSAERWVETSAGQQDLSMRAQSNYQLQKSLLVPEARSVDGPSLEAESVVSTGPLVPIWIGGADRGAPHELCFVRRVRVGEEALFQGFLADWPRLRTALMAQVGDLLPDSELVPRTGLDSTASAIERRLAVIPAELDAKQAPRVPLGLMTPVRATLWATWLAALVAVAAVGHTLRASIAYGEKRSRFASAVTHELRTPLTTFRMYAEMLAKGMVPENQRQQYFATLEKESNRLAHLVENVLGYAQLEEGARRLCRTRIGVRELVERALPMLERRAREAGASIALDTDAVTALELETDADAVGQILLNLVDNSCKYGLSGARAVIELRASAVEDKLSLCVRDHGPGVSAPLARAIFQPFERGDPRDPKPGIGLGLAIALGLARELGGDLRLERVDRPGASFCLELPLLRRS